jgi:hypothetical protein
MLLVNLTHVESGVAALLQVRLAILLKESAT